MEHFMSPTVIPHTDLLNGTFITVTHIQFSYLFIEK